MGGILLFGRDGQLGHALVAPLASLGAVTAMGRDEADFTDSEIIRATIRDLQPKVIVNAAAYTAVDRAEQETQTAMQVNAVAVGVLGEESAKIGARVIHYSTDYVFDGDKSAPYTEQDAPAPLNLYGESKLAGENALLGSGAQAIILRTSWVYAARGRNFVHTMLRIGRDRDEVRVVDDQAGAPTSAEDLAGATVALLRAWNAQPGGVYHAAAAGQTTWAGFAREIFSLAGLSTRVVPITTADYPTPARRPKNSLLDCAKLQRDFAIALPDWHNGLRRVMAQIAPSGN